MVCGPVVWSLWAKVTRKERCSCSIGNYLYPLNAWTTRGTSGAPISLSSHWTAYTQLLASKEMKTLTEVPRCFDFRSGIV